VNSIGRAGRKFSKFAGGFAIFWASEFLPARPIHRLD